MVEIGIPSVLESSVVEIESSLIIIIKPLWVVDQAAFILYLIVVSKTSQWLQLKRQTTWGDNKIMRYICSLNEAGKLYAICLL